MGVLSLSLEKRMRSLKGEKWISLHLNECYIKQENLMELLTNLAEQ